MLLRALLASVTFFLIAGCGKRSETSPSASPSATEPAVSRETAGAPNTEPPRAADVSEHADSGAPPTGQETPTTARADTSGTALAATLAELTQALRKYSFERQRLPKSFSEVVSAGYVKDMPSAPQGKKFAIEPKTVQVVLVKQ
jgi:hypothetical protein